MPTGDGATNIMKWDTGIPGKEATDWAGGVYKVTLEFNEVRASPRPIRCDRFVL